MAAMTDVGVVEFDLNANERGFTSDRDPAPTTGLSTECYHLRTRWAFAITLSAAIFIECKPNATFGFDLLPTIEDYS